MKGKQLAILLLLVVVLGGAWYFLSQRNRASWSESGGAGGKVVEFPINDVAALVIKSSAAQVSLVRKGDTWSVQERADYPANFEQVSDVLRKFWDLKTVQEVKAGPSQLPRLELIEPGKGDNAGTLVEFKDKDGKTLNALLLGKKSMRKTEAGPEGFGGFPNGRYLKTLAGTKISLVSETLENVDPKPEAWLQKDFVKVESPKSVAVAGATDAQKWTVSRDSATADWKLADAKPDEKLDNAKVSALGSVFAAPTFNDVLAADVKPEDTGLDKPTVATIETLDGFRYELKIGKANGEAHPVVVAVSAAFPKERTPGKDEKPEDKTKLDDEFKAKQKTLEEKLAKEKKFESRAFLVPKFAVEPLLKDRAALFPDKPADTTATPPVGVPGAPFGGPGGPGGAPGLPPGHPALSMPGAPRAPVSVTTPPVSAPAPKIEAVTPPVQAPPLPPAVSTPKPPAPPAPEPAPAKPDAAPAKPEPAPARPSDAPTPPVPEPAKL